MTRPSSISAAAFRAPAQTTVQASNTPSQPRQARRRHEDMAWQNPKPHPPKYIISNLHAPSLDNSLMDLARKLLAMDMHLFRRQNTLDQKLVASPDVSKANAAQERLASYKDVREQFKSIEICTSGFADSYLTNNAFIPVWRDVLKHVKANLSSKKCDEAEVQFHASFKSYASLAVALEEALVSAASQGVLSKDIEMSIRARWYFLDDVFNWHFGRCGLKREDDLFPTGDIKHWDKISSRISEAAKASAIATTSTNGAARAGTTSPGLPFADTALSQQHITNQLLPLYFIFLFGAILSTALFAVGYAKSTHEKGSTHDADFWFSCQASLAQATSLISSTLFAWCMGKASTWRWLLLTGISGICTMSTVPLYISVPKEWASFSALVATMLQSVLIVQQCFPTSIVTREEGDKKMK